MVENINLNIKKLHTPIYRILEFDRLIDILELKQNILSRPSIWDDPFEALLRYIEIKGESEYIDQPVKTFGEFVFAQCWTFLEENDLLWRVYSPHKDGVRIKSTPQKLINSLKKSSKIKDIIDNPKIIDVLYVPSKKDEGVDEGIVINGVFKAFIGEVEYLSYEEINNYLHSINAKSGISDLVKSVFIKREPFKNEEELRIGIYQFDKIDTLDLILSEDRYNYDFDLNEAFEEIVFDPRISRQKYNGLKDLIIKLGFKNIVSRSTIYDKP